MGILNIFKKSEEDKDKKQVADAAAPVAVDQSVEKKVVVKSESKSKSKSNIQAHAIILSPWVTEKATDLQTQNKYSFLVNPKANKIMVALAVRELYDVKPIKVNLIKTRGKNVRYGRTSGQTKDWRKAVITLKKGDKISLFEGV